MEMSQSHLYELKRIKLNIQIDVNYGTITLGAMCKVVKGHFTGCRRITFYILHFNLYYGKATFTLLPYIVFGKKKNLRSMFEHFDQFEQFY